MYFGIIRFSLVLEAAELIHMTFMGFKSSLHRVIGLHPPVLHTNKRNKGRGEEGSACRGKGSWREEGRHQLQCISTFCAA